MGARVFFLLSHSGIVLPRGRGLRLHLNDLPENASHCIQVQRILDSSAAINVSLSATIYLKTLVFFVLTVLLYVLSVKFM